MAVSEDEHDALAVARLNAQPDLLGAVYQAADGRRSAIDQMMWQAPALSLTAQAFLLTMAFQEPTAPLGRLIAGLLGLVAAVAAMQLVAKHRHHEVQMSRWLQQLEELTLLPRLNDRDARKAFADGAGEQPAGSWLAESFADTGSSFEWWLRALAVFGIADVIAVVLALVSLTTSWNPLAG